MVCGVWRKGLDRLSRASFHELSQLQEPELLRPQPESEAAGPQQTFLSLSAPLALSHARPSGTAVRSAGAMGTLTHQSSGCQLQSLPVVFTPPRGFTDPKGSRGNSRSYKQETLELCFRE